MSLQGSGVVLCALAVAIARANPIILEGRRFHHTSSPRRILVRYMNPPSAADKKELELAVKRQLKLKFSPAIFVELDKSPGFASLGEREVSALVAARALEAILTIRIARRQPDQTLRPEYACAGYCFDLRDARTRARIWADNEPLDWHVRRVNNLGDVARELVDEMVSNPKLRNWRLRAP